MTIKEHKDRLTNYRNNLICFIKINLKSLSPEVIKKLLTEIELCNDYIAAMHEWDIHYNYNTHSIVQSNNTVIRTIDEIVNRKY